MSTVFQGISIPILQFLDSCALEQTGLRQHTNCRPTSSIMARCTGILPSISSEARHLGLASSLTLRARAHVMEIFPRTASEDHHSRSAHFLAPAELEAIFVPAFQTHRLPLLQFLDSTQTKFSSMSSEARWSPARHRMCRRGVMHSYFLAPSRAHLAQPANALAAESMVFSTE